MTLSALVHALALPLLGMTLALPGPPAAAAAPRTARFDMVNAGILDTSTCRVFGLTTGGKRVSMLKEITHKGKSKTTRYTVTIPAEFDIVRFACRGPKQANVKYDLETARQPLDANVVKVTCASSQPDGRCLLSAYGEAASGGM